MTSLPLLAILAFILYALAPIWPHMLAPTSRECGRVLDTATMTYLCSPVPDGKWR